MINILEILNYCLEIGQKALIIVRISKVKNSDKDWQITQYQYRNLHSEWMHLTKIFKFKTIIYKVKEQ